ncbi:glycosyltransferase [Vibrio metschnikovii]|uniref:glycosyltransferase n=1 Tax=Vibrio metschnikovii TaxID=28172 RepID=UPI001C2F2775|nr:glycosyltransferase [Vibrio metschnikovii]
MLLKKANKLFTQGEYDKALEIYLQYEKQYGNEDVRVNIKLCLDRMGENSSLSDCYYEGVQSNQINDYFDHIYVVNLQHQHEKRLKIAKHLNDNNVRFEFYNATDGYQVELLDFFNRYKEKPLGHLIRYSAYSFLEFSKREHLIESPGAMGYIFTYISILEDAKKNGYKRFLILEDDVLLDNHFNDKFLKFIDSIDDDWKVLLLGASQYGWDIIDEAEAISRGYYYPGRTPDSINRTCGSFAIAFDYSVIDEVIEAQKSFESPFDQLPMNEIYQRYIGKCFVTFPNIVMPDVTKSTIRHGRDQFQHSHLMKWEIENFNFPLKKPSISILITSRRNVQYLDSFSHFHEMPFHLNLYINTADGIRPLHNKDLLFLDVNNNLLPVKDDVFLETDYAAIISEYDVLSETEVIRFLEYKLGFSGSNTSVLGDFNFQRPEIYKSRVSVIIPTYKRPRNLLNSLSSVLEQNYRDLEIIIVNDNGEGSDCHFEVIDLIDEINKKNHSNKIKLINHKTNRNGAAARNTGIMASTGEYICFLDDDDVYLPGRISESVAKLMTTPNDVGAVYCGFLGWNSSENDFHRYKEGDLTLDILMLDYKNHYLHTNTVTYKREAVLSINGFDESYHRHQDLEFNLRFFESYNVHALKKTLVKLNPEPSGVSNKVFDVDMLNLKNKFLSRFADKIRSQVGYEKEIYIRHWNEVVRYTTNKSSIRNCFFDDYKKDVYLLSFLD